MKLKSNFLFSFNDASSYFNDIHDSPGNQEFIWNYDNGFNYQRDIFLDFAGRKELVNYIRTKKYINVFTIRVFLPYEVQIPMFFLVNNPYCKKISRYNYKYLCKNTTFLFINEYNECKRYEEIISFFQGKNIPYIKHFAINVLRILKLSTNPLVTINSDFFKMTIEVASMILTTERLRSEKSLLISYIEFYKLKHTNDPYNTLRYMFNRSGSSLIFSQKGGAQSIIHADPNVIYSKFINMLIFSPVFNIFNSFPYSMQMILKNEFYRGKLEKLKAMSENRSCLHHSKFKFFVMATKNFFEFKDKLLMKKCFDRFKKI